MIRLLSIISSMGLIALILGSVSQAGGPNESTNAPPREVATSLKKHFPDMRLVQTKDINATSCKLRTQSEVGLVVKDFNADGVKDYAVLLIGAVVKRNEKWEGKNWPVHDVTLVVFTGQKDGTFNFKTLYTQEDSLPTIYNIQLQPKDELREVGTNKVVKMTTDGVKLSACEKFAVVYFYEGGQFRMIGIEG